MLDFKKSKYDCNPDNLGQTLIETMIAVFILVSGIAAAVGLAIFALSSSQNVTKQMIAVGLAREGVEAVKNMRDTNWLKQSAIDINCYNPKTGGNDAKCYFNWLGDPNLSIVPFCLNPTSSSGNCNGSATTQNYYLGFDPAAANFWNLQRQFGSDNYGLNFDGNAGGLSFKGFYPPSNSISGTADFFRKIILTKDDGVVQYGAGANNPFNKNTGPRLKVQSQVWWTDKKCPRVTDWPGLGKCSVELQTYLTNWKNY